MGLRDDVARGVGDPRAPVLVVDDGRAGRHRLLRVDDRGQHLVVHLDTPAALLGGRLAVRDHGRDPLADVPDDVVQDPGIGRVPPSGCS